MLELPNWSFSYALALKRLCEDYEPDLSLNGSSAVRCDDALCSALKRFPSVLGQLLNKNGVDVKSRSFRLDWPSVLNFFENISLDAHSSLSQKHVIGIFVKRHYKLWGHEDVLAWLYSVASKLRENWKDRENNVPNDDERKFENSCPAAVDRYLRADAASYADSFSTLPADANPLDEALVAPALAMDPNQRRRARIPRQFQQIDPHLFGADEVELQRLIFAQMEEGNGTVIDPDDPIVSVFLRSLFPWARVEGVPRS